MPKKLKVLFVAEDFYPDFIGGGGVYGYHLVKDLPKLGVDLTVLAENRPTRADFWRKKYIKLILTPFCFGNQLILALLQYFIFKYKLSNQFDIIHATQLSGLFFTLFKPKNSKLVITLHHTYFDIYKESDSIFKKLLYLPLIFLEKWMYQRADAVIFHTPFEREAVRHYYSLKKPTLETIYLGVDLPKMEKIKRNSKTVLYVGRLVKRKKVDTLIKAMSILHKQGVGVKAVIIGEGREKENLIKIAPPNVEFLGFVENTRPYFLSADVFVLTSVSEGGIALSVLEAASFELPLIISPSVAGFPILKEGKNGFIVEPNDVKMLAKRIRQVLPQARKMGKLSRIYAKVLSWEKTVKKTANFYDQLLGRG